MTYTAAHGNARSLTQWARPGIKPASPWILLWFIADETQWELPDQAVLFLQRQNIANHCLLHTDVCVCVYVCVCLWPQPQHMEVPRPRGRIGAIAPGLYHSHTRSELHPCSIDTAACSKAGSLTHWARLEIEPTSSWILVTFLTCGATAGIPKESSKFTIRSPLSLFFPKLKIPFHYPFLISLIFYFLSSNF